MSTPAELPEIAEHATALLRKSWARLGRGMCEDDYIQVMRINGIMDAQAVFDYLKEKRMIRRVGAFYRASDTVEVVHEKM